jgi:hypothetical protein
VVVQDLEDADDIGMPAPTPTPTPAPALASGPADCLALWRLGPLLLVREVWGDAQSPAQCGEWELRVRPSAGVALGAGASVGGGAGLWEESLARDAALLVAQCLQEGVLLG